MNDRVWMMAGDDHRELSLSPASLSRFAFLVIVGLSIAVLSCASTKVGTSGSGMAVWAGVSTALVAAIGIGYFGEELTALKLVSLLFIIVGVVGLNFGEAKP